MTDDLPAELRQAIAAEEMKPAPEDALAKVRDGVRRMSDRESEVADLKSDLASAERDLNAIRFKELPDLFQAAGIDSVGLGDEGVNAKLEPYYRANIAADWPTEKRLAAFVRLAELGGADIIKVNLTVTFARGEDEKVAALEKLLRDNGYEYSSQLGVPWQTLTAFVKEQVEAGNARLLGSLDIIGATVGKIVRVKEKKG